MEKTWSDGQLKGQAMEGKGFTMAVQVWAIIGVIRPTPVNVPPIDETSIVCLIFSNQHVCHSRVLHAYCGGEVTAVVKD